MARKTGGSGAVNAFREHARAKEHATATVIAALDGCLADLTALEVRRGELVAVGTAALGAACDGGLMIGEIAVFVGVDPGDLAVFGTRPAGRRRPDSAAPPGALASQTATSNGRSEQTAVGS